MLDPLEHARQAPERPDAGAPPRCSRRSAPRRFRNPRREAKELLFLRPDDGITMNRDRLLADAKARALAMAADYEPPEPIELTLPGPSGKLAHADGGGRLRALRPRHRARPRRGRRARRRADRRRHRHHRHRGRGRPARAGTHAASCALCDSRTTLWPASSTCSKPASPFGTEGDDRCRSTRRRFATCGSCCTNCTSSDSLRRPAGLRGDVSPDLFDSVLEEAAKFVEEVLLPLNMSGDEEGCRLENGVVRTPKGFREAYTRFREGGWTALACDPQFGGQGLPESVDKLVEEMICAANVSFGALSGPQLRRLSRDRAATAPRSRSNSICRNWSMAPGPARCA